MAATVVEKTIESKNEESSPGENSVMETAQAKGTIEIGIAKLQPTVRFVITYTQLWAYYTFVPLKIGQLTIDVMVLGLEIAKLFLIAVKTNTNLFVQLFQQLLAIFSPNFIKELMLSFSNTLTSLVERIMNDLLNLIQIVVDAWEHALKQQPELTEIPRSFDAGEVVIDATNKGAVNSGTSGKSEKVEKSSPNKG